MAEGMLAVAVFCMFAFGFYIHEGKRQYKEAEIVIFDVKGGSKKEF